MRIEDRVTLLRAQGRSERAARRIAEDEAHRAEKIRAKYPDGVPTFEAQRTARGFRFKCPVCGLANRHGGPAAHRASHCACWPGGYVLVPAKPESRR